MLDRLRNLRFGSRSAEEAPEEDRAGDGFPALRLLAAELFYTAGVNTTLHYLRQRPAEPQLEGSEPPEWGAVRSVPAPPRRPLAAAWAPVVLGSLAGTAHALQVFRPSETTRTMSRVLNGAVVSLGAAGLADSLYAAVRGDEKFSFAPLLFGYAGVFGFLLDRQERVVADQEEALERRARIVERLVPRRRPKLERIVVHV